MAKHHNDLNAIMDVPAADCKQICRLHTPITAHKKKREEGANCEQL